MEVNAARELENISKNGRENSIAKKWSKFNEVSPTVVILRGSYSMSDNRFKLQSRGHQGVACSVVAIVFGCLCSPEEWTFHHVDQILKYGDKLFRISQIRNHVKPGDYMTTKLIYREFFIEDYECCVCIEDNSVSGKLFLEDLNSPDLIDGLEQFFKTNNSGVLTAQEHSVAIWRHLEGFVYFDPSSCDELGVQSSDGVACVVRFQSLNDLRDLFLRNIDQQDNSHYTIDKVVISRVKLVDQGMSSIEKLIHADKNILKMLNSTETDKQVKDCIKTEVKDSPRIFPTKEPFLITISNYDIDTVSATTFIALTGDRAILHGLTHELSDTYTGKGAQSVANCIAIFGVKKTNPIKTWLRPKLDEILVLGDRLYAETKIKHPINQSLTAADFNNSQMIVNGKKLFNDVDLITIVGTLNSKDPSILSLKQAFEEFFLVHKNGVIESSSMTVAIWTEDDYFYSFDPRECDVNGIRMITDEKSKSGKSKKKNTDSLFKKIEGKCCVIRFPNIDALAAHILINTSSLKKNDRFTIRHITVMDDIPGTRMWNEFQPGEAGRTWILQGNISNVAEEFADESRGFQGIAMPIVALVKAQEIPLNEWTSEVIDQAIREGDAYFKWCVSTEEQKNNAEYQVLTLENLKTKLYVNNRQVIISIDELLASGRVKVNLDNQELNLTDGLKKLFGSHQHGIVELYNFSVAVWKHEVKNESGKESGDLQESVSYYCFDPNPRGKLGYKATQRNEKLAACVIRTVNLEEIARIIELNISEKEEAPDKFFIHGFKVNSISEPMTDEELIADKKIPIRPDLNNYSELSEDVAYLAGSFTQGNSLQFKSRTCNKQQAANALVALAMSKLYNPHLWYQGVVDDILKLGDKLTEENLDYLFEDEADIDRGQIKKDYLVPSQIQGFFDIGVNRATIEIEEGIILGSVNNLNNIITEFFQKNQMGILRQDEIMLPIWREGHSYFTFNPRGSNDQVTSIGKETDTATVYWSTTVPSLAMIIQQFLNINNNFTIDGIILENKYETKIAENERPKKSPSKENLWHNFVRFSDGMWKLVGDIAIDDEVFDKQNRNNQTAAIAIIAVLFSKIYEARQWNVNILSEIVIIGDQLHSKSAEGLEDNINLKVDQIIPEFFFSDRKLDLKIINRVLVGKVNQNIPTELETFFNKYESGILTIAGINIAVWKATDIYYCVISRNLRLSSNEELDKNITVYRFQTLQHLTNYLTYFFDTEEDYEMHAIEVINWNKLPPWKFDPSTAVRPSNLPSLNAFKRFQGYAQAILRGGIHQGSNIFPEAIRNQQTAANCVVALAMTLIKNPVTWTQETMDEILVIGLNVHEESLILKSSLTNLKPFDIIRVFQIGDDVLVVDIEAETITGQVSLLPPEPEVKGKKAKKVKSPKAKGKKKDAQTREPSPPPPPILLKEGLQLFFNYCEAGVLVIEQYMIALWKDKDVYFVYDPSGCNDLGKRDTLGAACTMWFAHLDPLYDLIYMNIDDSDRYKNYEICQAIIRTTIIEPLPNPVEFQFCLEKFTSTGTPVFSEPKTVSEYFFIDKEVSTLLGNCHMGDESFDVSIRGFQSTAIAAIAIVVSILHVPSTWTAELIDSIIKYGNILNQDSMTMVESGPRILSPSELRDVFVVGDFRANIYIERHTTAGILFLPDLVQALTLFFENNCTGILHTPDIAVAVMQHYGKFYMLDPRECDKFGRLSYDGTACLTKCKNIMRLASQFVNNYNYKVPCVYTINAVNILNVQFFSVTKDVNS